MNQVPGEIVLLFVLALAHLILSHALMKNLAREHPQVFQSIGSPDLFLNNTPRSVWLFWKWLFSSGPRAAGKGTIVLAWAIRLLTVVVVAVFGAEFWQLLSFHS